MKSSLELQRIIYSALKTQIQFGVYRVGQRLPTMEDACLLFGVSIRTIRNAYQQLHQEGFITMSRKVGVKVTVDYSEEEVEQHIQEFFIERRDALIDLGRSMQVLLSGAQWMGFKHVTPDQLDQIEELARREDILPPHKMVLQHQLIYGSLNNDMLMRLVWQIYMFFLAPFLSVPENLKGLEPEHSPLPCMIDLCRRQNWTQLRIAIETFQGQFSSALDQFYEKRITLPVPETQESFQWSSYKKVSQRCYSLGLEIMVGIRRGTYPAGSRLPSLCELAEEKHVSVDTVRRTLSLLNSIGVTDTRNGIGTYILPADDSAAHCDLTLPAVKKRLLDFLQSLQVLASSCRRVAEVTFSASDTDAIRQCRDRLNRLKRDQRCDLAAYSILELMIHLAPFHAVRSVYTSLFYQLLWGYPIRNMHGNQESLDSHYLPHLLIFLDCLDRKDVERFSVELETLLLSEVEFSASQMVQAGIAEAAVFSGTCL